MVAESKTIRLDEANSETTNPRWNWLYKISSAAGFSVGALFLTAVIDFVLTSFQPSASIGWLSSLHNNWLIVIYNLHDGIIRGKPASLYGWNLMDFVILALIGATYTGLYAALWRTNKTWSLIALVQPYLGIVLFAATKTAGRCGVMGAGLVISMVMLKSKLFNRRIAYSGILSGVLLLVGDLSVKMAPSNLIAVLTGIGYLLLTTWFFLVSRRLFQLGNSNQYLLNETMSNQLSLSAGDKE